VQLPPPPLPGPGGKPAAAPRPPLAEYHIRCYRTASVTSVQPPHGNTHGSVSFLRSRLVNELGVAPDNIILCARLRRDAPDFIVLNNNNENSNIDDVRNAFHDTDTGEDGNPIFAIVTSPSRDRNGPRNIILLMLAMLLVGAIGFSVASDVKNKLWVEIISHIVLIVFGLMGNVFSNEIRSLLGL
jgi:hypothetical protein